MIELMVQKALPPINWAGVPARFVGKASAVCRSLVECQELVKWFGSPDFCPLLPVLVQSPQGWTAIPGFGYAPASELQDCAVVAWHRKPMDFDEKRERGGLMRKEDVPAEMADALTRRIAHHKANPITDPARQPVYPNPTGRTLHAVAKIEEVNE